MKPRTIRTISSLLLLTVVVSAQERTVSARRFVDSLLQVMQSDTLTGSYHRLDENSLNMMLGRIASADTSDQITCENICIAFGQQKGAFDATRIPTPIAAIYQVAVQGVEQQKLRDAVKAFYVAFALKRQFVETEKARLLRNYSSFLAAAKAENRDSLEHYLRAFDAENTTSPAFMALDQDEHLSLQYATIGKQVRLAMNRRAYEEAHADSVLPSFAVRVSGAARFAGGRLSPTRRLTDYLVQNEMYVPRNRLTSLQTAVVTPVPEIAIWGMITPSIGWWIAGSRQFVHLEQLGKILVTDPSDIKYNDNVLDVTCTDLVVGVRHLLRPTSGIRLAVEAGTGIEFTSSPAKKLFAAYQFTYYSVAMSEMAPFVRGGGTVEYAPSGSGWIAEFTISGIVFLDTGTASGTFSADARVGISYMIGR